MFIQRLMINSLLLLFGSVNAIRMSYLDLAQDSLNAAAFGVCVSSCGVLTQRAMPATCTTEDCFCVKALDNNNILGCVTCLSSGLSANVTLATEVDDILDMCNDPTGTLLDILRGVQPCKVNCEPLVEALYVCNPNTPITTSSCICDAVADDLATCQSCLLVTQPADSATTNLLDLTVNCLATPVSSSSSSSSTSPLSSSSDVVSSVASSAISTEASESSSTSVASAGISTTTSSESSVLSVSSSLSSLSESLASSASVSASSISSAATTITTGSSSVPSASESSTISGATSSITGSPSSALSSILTGVSTSSSETLTNPSLTSFTPSGSSNSPSSGASSISSIPVSSGSSIATTGPITSSGTPTTSATSSSSLPVRPNIILFFQLKLVSGGGFLCINGEVFFSAAILSTQGSLFSLYSDSSVQCEGQKLTISVSIELALAKRQGGARLIPITLVNPVATIPAGDFQTSFGIDAGTGFYLNNAGISYTFGIARNNRLVVFNGLLGSPAGLIPVAAVPVIIPPGTGSGIGTGTGTGPGSGSGSGSGSVSVSVSGSVSVSVSGSITINNGFTAVINGPVSPVVQTPSQCNFACVNIFLSLASCTSDDFNCLCSAGVSSRSIDGFTVVRSAFQFGSTACQACIGRQNTFSGLFVYISNVQAICLPSPSAPIVIIIVRTITITTYTRVTTVYVGAGVIADRTTIFEIPATITTTRSDSSVLATAGGVVIAPFTTRVLAVVYSTSIRGTATIVSTSTVSFGRSVVDSRVGAVSVDTIGISNNTIQLFQRLPVAIIFPRLLIPVMARSPTTAFGNQIGGTINVNGSMLALFDVPAGTATRQCLFEFGLPDGGINPANYPSYSLTESSIQVSLLSGPISVGTTFENMPSVVQNLGAFSLSGGFVSVLTKQVKCVPGTTIVVLLGSSANTALTWIESASPNTGIVLNQY